jgi:hypothetical protein
MIERFKTRDGRNFGDEKNLVDLPKGTKIGVSSKFF